MFPLFQEPPLGNGTNVHRPWADVYRFGALVVVPILTHLGQGAVYRHHDDRPWNFWISSQHPQWTLLACPKHGDSSAKLRGCRMPTISSTILPLHSQTINMSWRWGRTCWCWWNRKIMQVADTWAQWMFISLQYASSHDNQDFILNRETGLSSCGAPREKFSFYFEPGDCQQTIITKQVKVKLLSNTKLLQFL